MVHPATQRVVRAAIVALHAALDVGLVFPPKFGEDRGYGIWTNRDLGLEEILAMLPRAAAANFRGGNVYMRLGPSSRNGHPGIVMLDDVDATAVEQLSRDGFEPTLVVQTSSGNYQAWVRLITEGTVDYGIVTQVVRHLARAYGGDERAVSPRQPGRLPGFTNRKPKHQLGDGKFPFVRLTDACPGRVASNGAEFIHWLSELNTAGAAAGAAAQTPHSAAVLSANLTSEIVKELATIYQAQMARISREVAERRRPADAGSASEVDFAFARAALASGIEKRHITDWLRRTRTEKDEAYSERTVSTASSWRFVPK